jgi:hypothetical protein
MLHHHQRRRMVEKYQKQVAIKLTEKTNKKAVLHLKSDSDSEFDVCNRFSALDTRE